MRQRWLCACADDAPNSDGNASCNDCHVLDEANGFFGTGGGQSFEGEPQNMKIPHLRNAYAKVGMFGMFVEPNLTLGPSTGEVRRRRAQHEPVDAIAEAAPRQQRDRPAHRVPDRDEGIDPELVGELRRRRIHTSVAQSRSAMPDLGARGITTAVRASVHYYNTDDEIDAFIAALDHAR